MMEIIGQDEDQTFMEEDHNNNNNKQQKSYVTILYLDDFTKHPSCSHGPTLLFSITKNNSESIDETGKVQAATRPKLTSYFACSACRTQNDCKFYLKINIDNDKLLTKDWHKTYSSEQSTWPLTNDDKNLLPNIKQLPSVKRIYCHTCDVFLLDDTITESTHKNHKITNITDDQLKYPAMLLHPLENDKREAQYFFTNSTLNELTLIMKKLMLTKIICIGAPRLHEYLKNNFKLLNIKSVLLDFDKRYRMFYDDSEYFWYNMFNNHFFNGIEAQSKFKTFLIDSTKNDLIAIFTDPPFAGRTEPIAITIKTIYQQYQQINGNPLKTMTIFWIFPYFMETYIKNVMPEMDMIDLKINYLNHRAYNGRRDNTKCKFGSPIRLFTNVPLNGISLEHTNASEYKFCKQCNRWTFSNNVHCKFCNKCPSKNGSIYRHCQRCAICVKPNYKHCPKCLRCTQLTEQHNCREYQLNTHCWICTRKGHNELNCMAFFKYTKKSKKLMKLINESKRKLCLICKKFGHNERFCKKRYLLNSKINLGL